MGDDGRDKYDNGTIKTSWAMEMTLWDTVTNEMTLIPHPPGIDTNHEDDDGSVHEDMRFVQWCALENQQSQIYVVNEVTLTGQNPSLKFF